MKTLVIVESAAKAKTIQKYLNEIQELKKFGSFQVLASFGHINDIPQKEIGVDLSTWEATYTTIPGKEKVIAQLRKAIKECDSVLIASDPDLEGEAIANHLQKQLRIPSAKRISFREITKNALRDAVLQPRSVDENKVAAQESRRILDRIVGYELSPLLWRRFATSGLSAGRVQSVALKMLVDRATHAKQHEPTCFWTLEGDFKVPCTDTVLRGKQDSVWESKESIKKVVNSLNKKAWDAEWTACFEQKQSKRNPSAPFTTSSLQQEAYERLRLPAKTTMRLAQSLYEHGYITYMRTDSVAFSEEAAKSIHGYIGEAFGRDMVEEHTYKSKAANAQEAHEAVRPSKVHVLSKDIEDEELTDTHRKLYDLIWRRAVASQMAPALYTDIHFTITSKSVNGYEFRGKHSFLVQEGFLKVYSPDTKATPQDLQAWTSLLQAGVTRAHAVSFEAEGDITKPISLYNEPMLVKALEKEGIGRPSTYATIIEKLFTKGYVTKGSAPQSSAHTSTIRVDVATKQVHEEEKVVTVGCKEADRMVPTSLGERVAEYLTSVTPFMVDTKFTSTMESSLDLVSEGKQNKKQLLDSFYKPFHDAVEKAVEEQQRRQPSKETKTARKEQAPKAPSKILKEFASANANIVQTRFGPALFSVSEQRFVSITPYMDWKNKVVDDITEHDATFLLSLPLKFEGTTREIHLGRYGLYVKDGDKNIHLPKELWDSAWSKSICAKDIISLQYVEPSKKTFKKRAAH